MSSLRIFLCGLCICLSAGCALLQPHPADPTKADLSHLPRNADGSLNVQLLVTWIGDGVMVVCDYDPQSPVCTIGMNAVQVLATKGQDPRAVLGAALSLEDQFPIIRAWFRWFSDTLTNWIALLTAPPAPV